MVSKTKIVGFTQFHVCEMGLRCIIPHTHTKKRDYLSKNSTGKTEMYLNALVPPSSDAVVARNVSVPNSKIIAICINAVQRQ